MRKRLKITMGEYNELIEARDWCKRNGFEGFAGWYDLKLMDLGKRRALPLGVQGPQEDDRDERRDYR